MKALHIHCPHCLKTSELYLKSKPYVMIFYCPECRSTLLHNEGRTVEINNMEIVRLKKNQIIRFVQGLKERFVSQENNCLSTPSQVSCMTAEKSQTITSVHADKPFRTIPITRDDVLNLRIDLELTSDVTDFLNRIS